MRIRGWLGVFLMVPVLFGCAYGEGALGEALRKDAKEGAQGPLASAGVWGSTPNPYAAEPTAEPRLLIESPTTLRPFEPGRLVINLPEDGTLTVLVEDAVGQEKPVAEQMPVKQGELALAYDATSWGGMPLREGEYTLRAVLMGQSGLIHAGSAGFTCGRPAAVLEDALPKSPSLYQRQDEVWFLDCSVTGACTIYFEVYANEEMTRLAASVRKKLNNAGQFRIAWTGRKNGDSLKPGTYHCVAYASGAKERGFRFQVELLEGREPKAELSPTGALLPASREARDVWEAMTRPMVVVDIEATAHQRLYQEPDPDSPVMGTVHGQSQALEVVEVGKRYTLVRAWRHEDGALAEGYVPTKKLKVVTPNPHYGLLIDKERQTLTVYEYGEPIGQVAVSTGLMDVEKLFRETRAGAFMTTDRLVAFESGGFRYDYPIRIDGGNLLHQVGYVLRDNKRDFSAQLPQLGQKASEGCVRLDVQTSAHNPLNAYWLWTHLEYGTKVLVLDDKAQREERLMALGISEP